MAPDDTNPAARTQGDRVAFLQSLVPAPIMDGLVAASERPGVRSTEFWLSVILSAVGTALTQQDQQIRQVIGGVLLAVALLSYNLSRGLVKRASAASSAPIGPIVPLLLAGVLALLLGGCSSTSEQRLHVVREGRILLRAPSPGDARWEGRRKIFLSDADLVDPPEGN